MKLKVFKMNDCDWYIAPNLEGAIKSIMCDHGSPKEDCVDSPTELSFEDMGKLKFIHDDYGEMTFAQEFYRLVSGGFTKAGLFASTEY